MKLWTVVVAVLIGIVASVPNAQAVSCATGVSYTVYEGYGATGCTIGDKTFSGFDFAFAPASLETGPPPFAITVTPFTDNPNTPAIPNDIGFQLTFLLTQSGPGSQDITVVYNVTAPGATITDAHLGFGGSASGTGTAEVTETVCPAVGACQTRSLLVIQSATEHQNTDFVFFSPVQSLHIVKDIGVTVPAGTTGTAIISEVDQSFTQTTPEPATLLLLGSGLAGAGVFGRRRLKKARA